MLQIHPSTVRASGNQFAVELEFIGEGRDGDYDPTDGEDTPLYRFTTYRRSGRSWLEVDDGSYCTLIPATCQPAEARRAAAFLLIPIELGAGSSVKRLCERLSWTSLETIAQAA